MYPNRNPVRVLGLVGLVVLAGIQPSPAQDANQDAKGRAKAKKDIKEALTAFSRTINAGRCSDCKGTGEVIFYPPLATGFRAITGEGRKEQCSACRGTGTSVQCRPNKKAASDVAQRYGISKVFEFPNHPVLGATGEYPPEAALSAQYSLERYLDLLDLLREHTELLEKDKGLRSAVDNARKQARVLFGRHQSLFEAIAYQIAKSHKNVKRAGVCLTAFVEQVVTIDDKRYARLEKAEHSWLVRVPDSVRWTEQSVVRVVGRIVDDVDYTTVLGANRTATVIEPSLDSE